MADLRRPVLIERLCWAVLVAAPWILHLGTGDFTPAWGAPEIPMWTVVGAFAAAAIGIVLGWVGVRRGLPATHRARYLGLVAASVLVATAIALVGLFELVHLFAVVLALPYGLALVGAAAGWRKRTPNWAEK